MPTPVPPNRRFLAFLLLGPWLALLVRLPLFFTPRLYPDVDESIVGMMALGLLRGEQFPLFFLGQRYGLALIEILPLLVLYPLAGVAAWTTKLAPLLVWLAGWPFYVLAARHAGGRRAAWILGVLLIGCTPWLGRAMKLHAGYVSGYAVCGIFLWQWVRLYGPQAERGGWGRHWALGLLAGLGVGCHPVWLPTLAPLMLWGWWRRCSGREALGQAAGAVAAVAGIYSLGFWLGSSYWNPPAGFQGLDVVRAAMALPGRMFHQATNAYYMQFAMPAGAWLKGMAAFWCLGIVAALAWTLWRWMVRRRLGMIEALGWALISAIGATLILPFDRFAYRYLLPVYSIAPLLMAVAGAGSWRTAAHGPWRHGVAAVLLCYGLGSLGAAWQARDVIQYQPFAGGRIAPRAAMADLLAALHQRGIDAVFTEDPYLQWEIMLNSGGRVRARWHEPLDRAPVYPRAVDGAWRAGRPTALIARGERIAPMQAALGPAAARSGAAFTVHDGYFWVLPDPDAAALAAGGFALNAAARPGG